MPEAIELIGPAFTLVHRAIRLKTHSTFWLRGGRGSLKSSFAAIEIIIGMMDDPTSNAVAFRKNRSWRFSTITHSR